MPTRIDMTDAAAAWQSDIPDPTGGLRCGDSLAGDRRRRVFVRHLDRHRRVAEKHVAAVLERNVQLLADQKRAEAAAVDEQIAFNLAGLLGDDAADVAVFGEGGVLDIRENMP